MAAGHPLARAVGGANHAATRRIGRRQIRRAHDRARHCACRTLFLVCRHQSLLLKVSRCQVSRSQVSGAHPAYRPKACSRAQRARAPCAMTHSVRHTSSDGRAPCRCPATYRFRCHRGSPVRASAERFCSAPRACAPNQAQAKAGPLPPSRATDLGGSQPNPHWPMPSAWPSASARQWRCRKAIAARNSRPSEPAGPWRSCAVITRCWPPPNAWTRLGWPYNFALS
jgi:hypothetical protein